MSTITTHLDSLRLAGPRLTDHQRALVLRDGLRHAEERLVHERSDGETRLRPVELTAVRVLLVEDVQTRLWFVVWTHEQQRTYLYYAQ